MAMLGGLSACGFKIYDIGRMTTSVALVLLGSAKLSLHFGILLVTGSRVQVIEAVCRSEEL